MSTEFIGLLITIGLLLIAIGRWIANREGASRKIVSLEKRIDEIDEWRTEVLPEYLEKTYVRRDTLELRLSSIESNVAGMKQEVHNLGKQVNQLVLHLVGQGSYDRRRQQDT